MRLVCAGLAAAAVWLVTSALLPRPQRPQVPVVVAAHDVAIGATLAPDDLRLVQRDPDDAVAGTIHELDAAVGQVVSGPVGSGEALTSNRFRGPPQLAGLSAEHLAVAVPVSDSALVQALRPADVVTVLVAGSGQSVASQARVLGAPAATETDGSPGQILLAVTTEEARAIASAMGGGAGPTSFVLALRG